MKVNHIMTDHKNSTFPKKTKFCTPLRVNITPQGKVRAPPSVQMCDCKDWNS